MKKKDTVEILLLDKKSRSEIVKLFSVNKAVIYKEIRRISDERMEVNEQNWRNHIMKSVCF